MAENKRSFVLYCDIIHTVSQLSDEKAGELFKHILSYVNDKNPVNDDIIINLTFEPIKQQLKRDLQKWREIKGKRSNAGKASAAKRKQKKQKLTHVNKSQQSSTNPTVNVNDNVTVNDNVNNIYTLYPSSCKFQNNRSTGKSSKDKKKIETLLKTHNENELTNIINTYIFECDRTKTYYKNFSTFLNNLPDIENIEIEVDSKGKPKPSDQHLLIINPDGSKSWAIL